MDVGALTEEADWIFGLLEEERPYPPTADELMYMTMEDEDIDDEVLWCAAPRDGVAIEKEYGQVQCVTCESDDDDGEEDSSSKPGSLGSNDSVSMDMDWRGIEGLGQKFVPIKKKMIFP